MKAKKAKKNGISRDVHCTVYLNILNVKWMLCDRKQTAKNMQVKTEENKQKKQN